MQATIFYVSESIKVTKPKEINELLNIIMEKKKIKCMPLFYQFHDSPFVSSEASNAPEGNGGFHAPATRRVDDNAAPAGGA